MSNLHAVLVKTAVKPTTPKLWGLKQQHLTISYGLLGCLDQQCSFSLGSVMWFQSSEAFTGLDVQDSPSHGWPLGLAIGWALIWD